MQNMVIIFGAKYLFAVIILIAVVYFLKQDRIEQKRMLTLSFIALPTAYIVAKIGNFLYFDPRPFVTGHFIPLISHAPDNGFPSDHTLISAAIASVVYFNHRKLGVALLIIAGVVGIARVLAGVHSFVDIFGSMVIAFGVTWLVNSLRMRYCEASSLRV